jgi:hypothetical protein
VSPHTLPDVVRTTTVSEIVSIEASQAADADAVESAQPSAHSAK